MKASITIWTAQMPVFTASLINCVWGEIERRNYIYQRALGRLLISIILYSKGNTNTDFVLFSCRYPLNCQLSLTTFRHWHISFWNKSQQPFLIKTFLERMRQPPPPPPNLPHPHPISHDVESGLAWESVEHKHQLHWRLEKKCLYSSTSVSHWQERVVNQR